MRVSKNLIFLQCPPTYPNVAHVEWAGHDMDTCLHMSIYQHGFATQWRDNATTSEGLLQYLSLWIVSSYEGLSIGHTLAWKIIEWPMNRSLHCVHLCCFCNILEGPSMDHALEWSKAYVHIQGMHAFEVLLSTHWMQLAYHNHSPNAVL